LEPDAATADALPEPDAQGIAPSPEPVLVFEPAPVTAPESASASETEDPENTKASPPDASERKE
jgi:hypothetical protein